MNKDNIERFDTVFFNKLNQKDKEKYYLSYIKKSLKIMEKGGSRNAN